MRIIFSLLSINLIVSNSSNLCLNSGPYLLLSKSSRYFLIGNFAFLNRWATPFSLRNATSPSNNSSATEMAGTIVYLVSPAGAYVNGQEIVIDGGALTVNPSTA